MSKIKDFVVKHRNAVAVSCTPVVMSLVSVASFAEEVVPSVDITSSIDSVVSTFGSIATAVAAGLVAMVGVLLLAAAGWIGVKAAFNVATGFLNKLFSH